MDGISLVHPYILDVLTENGRRQWRPSFLSATLGDVAISYSVLHFNISFIAKSYLLHVQLYKKTLTFI